MSDAAIVLALAAFAVTLGIALAAILFNRKPRP